MFEGWRRPDTDLPGRREGYVLSLAFEDPETILQAEGWAIVSASLVRDRRFASFIHGFGLAGELAHARATKGYEGTQHIVLIVLFAKALNDLLASCVSMRVGYSLQAYPLLRAALECGEIMEYLATNPSEVDDYVRGTPPFDRDLSWLRDKLPATDTRRKAYGYFNYYTHNNIKGIRIYTTYDARPSVEAVNVGPLDHPVPEIVPYVFATALLAYITRTTWKLDESAAPKGWIERFQAFDESTESTFAELPELEEEGAD